MAHGQKKPRVPRWPANPTAASGLLESLRYFEEEEAATLANEARMSWHRLTVGTGTKVDYDRVAVALNISAVLCEKAALPTSFERVELAQHALVGIRERFNRLGKFGADAIALRDIPLGLDVHDALLPLLNPLQLVQAMRECYDNIVARNVIDLRPVGERTKAGAL